MLGIHILAWDGMHVITANHVKKHPFYCMSVLLQVEHTLLDAKFKSKTAIKRQMNQTANSIF